MYSQRNPHQFINQFVDAVTVRPFLNDLRRMKQSAAIFRTLPRLVSTEAVRSATEAFDNPDEPKFLISGPDIRMTSGAVVAIAMTLNELCTNTTKFGALSVPQGLVEISWTLDQQTQRLHLTWTEKNGAAVRPPEKRSFGTRLIETLGRQLRGNVRLTYEPTGFVYTLDVPMASLTSAAA